MPSKKNTESFEECFDQFEKAVNALKNEDLTLEQSFKSYQSGMEYYEKCKHMLEELKQKIEVYDRRLDVTKKIEVD